jgi:hypothetical protein
MTLSARAAGDRSPTPDSSSDVFSAHNALARSYRGVSGRNRKDFFSRMHSQCLGPGEAPGKKTNCDRGGRDAIPTRGFLAPSVAGFLIKSSVNESFHLPQLDMIQRPPEPLQESLIANSPEKTPEARIPSFCKYQGMGSFPGFPCNSVQSKTRETAYSSAPFRCGRKERRRGRASSPTTALRRPLMRPSTSLLPRAWRSWCPPSGCSSGFSGGRNGESRLVSWRQGAESPGREHLPTGRPTGRFSARRVRQLPPPHFPLSRAPAGPEFWPALELFPLSRRGHCRPLS